MFCGCISKPPTPPQAFQPLQDICLIIDCSKYDSYCGGKKQAATSFSMKPVGGPFQ